MIEKPLYKILPASQGYLWVKHGTELLRGNFGRWLVTFLLFTFMYLVSWFYTFSFLMFNVFSPVLWGGMFLAGISTLNKLEWSATILFEPLKKHSTNLLKLGAVITALNTMIGFLLLSKLSELIDFQELYKVLEVIGKTGDQALLGQFFSDPFVLQQILLSILVALLVSMPIMMAGWFAPVLIMEKNLSPFLALKLSFQACTANFKAFLVYGLVTMVMAWFVLMSMYIALLFIGPLFFTSYYCSYDDIFETDQLDETTIKENQDESDATMVV